MSAAWDSGGISQPAATSGRAAVLDVPHVAPETLAGDALARLTGRRWASGTEIAVLDDGRLVGVVPIEALLAAAGDTPVRELAQDPAAVLPDVDLEEATRAAALRGGRCVAVADADGRFVGLVPPDRLLHVLELEHEEDLARLGGFLTRASEALLASEEAIPRRLWHRLPWLGLGLLGAMASAVVVGAFEEELRKEVLLALFVPAVVYMADAVGTQTVAVVVRGMSQGVALRTIVVRELMTGVLLGALMGSAFFPFALVAWGDARVAATVGISLAISASVATLVAMALPYGIARLGRDPAFGSGPLATVIQDLLTIVAYFTIALLLVP